MIQPTIVTWSALLTLVLLPAVAYTDEAARGVELTPYSGYNAGGTFDLSSTDETVDLGDSASFGMLLDIRKTGNTQWEILYGRQDADASAVTQGTPNPTFALTFDTLQIGGTYQWEGDELRPFLAATIGGTRIDVTNAGYGADTFFSFSLGLGLQYRPQSRVGLRLEWRTFGTLMNSKTDLFCTSGGTTNACLIQLQGDVLWQTGAFAGLVFRF